MKHVLTAALVVLPSLAAAKPFVELDAGVAVPVSDDDWTDFVDPSFTLGARIGAQGRTLGGMGSLDWSPLSEDANGISLQRLRVLGHVRFASRLSRDAELVGRVGAGLDYVHLHGEVTIPGLGTVESNDSDTGFALEFGGGMWFRVAPKVKLGGELAFPIAFHSDDDSNVDYTSIDFDLLFGVHLTL